MERYAWQGSLARNVRGHMDEMGAEGGLTCAVREWEGGHRVSKVEVALLALLCCGLRPNSSSAIPLLLNATARKVGKRNSRRWRPSDPLRHGFTCVLLT